MANPTIDILSNILEQATKIAEEHVDAKLSQLSEMDEDELERLKEKRLEGLKKAQKQKQVSVKISGICIYTYLICIYIKRICYFYLNSITCSKVLIVCFCVI